MPAVLEKKEKQCRMDIRLAQSQRRNYERAASLRGQTLTQWATSTMLTPQAFDEFCAMLDAPMPQATTDLLSRKAVWE